MRALWVATGVLVVAYLASTIFRNDEATSAFWDAGIGNAGYAGCALLCLARARHIRQDRWAWTVVAAALLLFTAGAVLWTTAVQFWDPVPYPSIADAAFLLFYPVAYLGVGLLARGGVPKGSLRIWSDGMIAAFGVAALEASIVIAPISRGTLGDAATVATNLAYPIGDLVCVVMVVAVIGVLGWRPGRQWWVLGSGLIVFAAADSVYVLRVTNGTYVTGTPLDSLWLIGTFLIATAAWTAAPVRRAAGRRRPGIALPVAFLGSSLLIVLVGTVRTVLPLAIALAGATLVLAILRLIITHRKLQGLEAQAHDLLEAGPEAILCVAEDGTVAISNARAASLFGCSTEELIGLPIEELVPGGLPSDREGSTPTVSPAPGTQGRRRDGTFFPAELTRSALESPNGALVSVAIRDISSRLVELQEREELLSQASRAQMERQLLKSQRLESLGQLAGGVAHDFNNLLAAIRSYSSLVETELAAGSVEPGGERWLPVLDDVRQIEQTTDRAAALTGQLLAFARRDVTRPEIVDLNASVTGIEKLLRRTIGEQVELVLDLTADVGRVRVDPGQLDQVVVNLVVNARDAVKAGGRITVSTAVVVLDGELDAEGRPVSGRFARLRVVDTGVGMAPETLERVFEPFFTTKEEGSGTGLGLATVYGIVIGAGGLTRIDSSPGRGTTVDVLLPLTLAAPPQPPAPEAAGPVPARAEGQTVLLVEDDDAIREATRRLLARHGYHVLVAADGDQALAEAERHAGPIDVLLTDVIMRGMPGPVLAARLGEVRPEVEVLFMSGYTAGHLDVAGELAPGAELLQKPFTSDGLLDAVGRRIRRPNRATASRADPGEARPRTNAPTVG